MRFGRKIQLINFLILRLRNAALAMDQRGEHNLAALLTEAIHELERIDAKNR